MPEVESSLAPLAAWGRTVFAFRGYNITNLGRTKELLERPDYAPILQAKLDWASDVCSQVVQRPVNLARRVMEGRETDLEAFDEAVALIVAVELAQLEILQGLNPRIYSNAVFTFGYSLGEITALTAAGLIEPRDALMVPLSVAADCSQLARDVTMGVVFSREQTIDIKWVQDTCRSINQKGAGLIAISSILAPNALLVLGEGETVKEFKEQMSGGKGGKIHIRENPYKWPPLHTPLLWRRHIPNRAGLKMLAMPGGSQQPNPAVLSLAVDNTFYNKQNYVELLCRWIDHPQNLWSAVYKTLYSGVDTVVHVGPEPNLAPATFKRLGDNVAGQMQGSSLYSLGMWAVSRNAWLAKMIVSDACLLRAPYLKQVNLEDWLLDAPR